MKQFLSSIHSAEKEYPIIRKHQYVGLGVAYAELSVDG